MFQPLVDAIAAFAITYVIVFVILIFLFKICIGKVMKLLGADYYTFSLKKRLKIISIISLIFAVLAVFGGLLA